VIELVVENDPVPLAVEAEQVDLVGYAGRDETSVAAHLAELAELGVDPPEHVPMVWQVPGRLLATAGRLIDADPASCSGEAEPVLVRHGREWYVTVGSDHTDRDLERSSIQDAKEACPKLVVAEAWPLADVHNHWDDLELRSFVLVDGQWRPYQAAPITELRHVDWYLATFDEDRPGDRVVFCGTVPTISGLVLGADGFRAELVDPTRGLTLRCEYQVAARSTRPGTAPSAGERSG
jgi:hypothetical protein